MENYYLIDFGKKETFIEIAISKKEWLYFCEKTFALKEMTFVKESSFFT